MKSSLLNSDQRKSPFGKKFFTQSILKKLEELDNFEDKEPKTYHKISPNQKELNKSPPKK
jgi:hypothetical protein